MGKDLWGDMGVQRLSVQGGYVMIHILLGRHRTQSIRPRSRPGVFATRVNTPASLLALNRTRIAPGRAVVVDKLEGGSRLGVAYPSGLAFSAVNRHDFIEAEDLPLSYAPLPAPSSCPPELRGVAPGRAAGRKWEAPTAKVVTRNSSHPYAEPPNGFDGKPLPEAHVRREGADRYHAPYSPRTREEEFSETDIRERE